MGVQHKNFFFVSREQERDFLRVPKNRFAPRNAVLKANEILKNMVARRIPDFVKLAVTDSDFQVSSEFSSFLWIFIIPGLKKVISGICCFNILI